jgi:hypothetical protein
MTPREYFESQAFFNKNLKEMSKSDQEHIILMLSEYGIMQVEACREFVMGEMNKLRESFAQTSENQNND